MAVFIAEQGVKCKTLEVISQKVTVAGDLEKTACSFAVSEHFRPVRGILMAFDGCIVLEPLLSRRSK